VLAQRKPFLMQMSTKRRVPKGANEDSPWMVPESANLERTGVHHRKRDSESTFNDR